MQNSASAIYGSPDFLPTTARVLCRNPQNGQKRARKWPLGVARRAQAVIRQMRNGNNKCAVQAAVGEVQFD
ncbi:hypothetical protein GCM10010946_20040 [Undibacterium squillarum]|uniref:Uncharacterized protein n=1 Tax=Undibacterium squillarum TaxID=1131567 RepID=A0ABQ2XZ90_9BURK|nr:hypothetical protein GCM10010946_20040 [Undibacterium squillarum]